MKKYAYDYVKNWLRYMLTGAQERILRGLLSALNGQRPNQRAHLYFYCGTLRQKNPEIFLSTEKISVLIDGRYYMQTWKKKVEQIYWTDRLQNEIPLWGLWFRKLQNEDHISQLEAMWSLVEDASINHHITTSYRLWAKGTVRNLCK